MALVPVIVLAGQSNASMPGVDNRLYELATAQGSAFELVKASLGGTTLLARSGPDWDPASTGELFDKLVELTLAAIARVLASGNTPVVTTLWIQGESDAVEPNASQYQQMLTGFIGAFRAAISMEHSTFAISLLPDAGKVRDAQLAAAAAGDGVIAIETAGAVRWDTYHYDKATREKIAEDFFAAAKISVPDVLYDNHLAVMLFSEDADRVIMHGAGYADVNWSHPELVKPASVVTYSGDDTIVTGRGADDIQTGGNNDSVRSNGGDDTIDLGLHDDFADAGPGNDTVYGQEGNDIILGGSGDDVLSGGLQADQVMGGSGNDTVDGGEGNDQLFGADGNDVLTGGDGNDQLSGGTGADRMEGGFGNDLFIIDNAGDVVIEGPARGTDTVRSSTSFALPDNVENLVLTGAQAINGTGNAMANRITGNAAGNVMIGGDGADLLYGFGGTDRLDGGAGADILQGGIGADMLTGRAGADRFLFQAADLAGTTPPNCDTIVDFSHADRDRIVLPAIADSANHRFAFIGTAAFHHVAGEVRYEVADGHAVVTGDSNGDSLADFAIRLEGITTLVRSDFVL